VHQDLGLVERRPVVENLALDRRFLRTRLGFIDWKRERVQARNVLQDFDASFGVDQLVDELSRGEQALTAIMRAFDPGTREMTVLVLDEPTVGLPPHEVDLVLATVQRVSARGISVVFVSHSIEEIQRACHTVTVLRDGRVTLDASSEHLTRAEIVEALSGHQHRAVYEPSPEPPVSVDAEVVLEVRNLRSATIRGIDIVLSRGEVCGVVGNLDSGAVEVLPAVYGDLPARADTVVVRGTRLASLSPRVCRKAGLAYMPADRRRDALLAGMTLRENIIAGDASQVCSHSLMRLARERLLVSGLIRSFGINPPQPERLIDTFSGGNQQKAMLARCMRLQPPVLLMQEPTQGVDVGAREDIAAHIQGAAQGGAAVLIYSTDVAELARLCQRVIIMRAGSIAGSLRDDVLTVPQLRHAIHDIGEPA
jgi:ribose transport system ATP-binding protein